MIPEMPFDYRGWSIWDWSGWVLEYSILHSDGMWRRCAICQGEFSKGEKAVFRQNTTDVKHYRCVRGSEDAPSPVWARWLAANEKRGSDKYLCVSIGLEGVHCESYEKGGELSMLAYRSSPVMETASDEEKERLCLQGLQALKDHIDRFEDAA